MKEPECGTFYLVDGVRVHESQIDDTPKTIIEKPKPNPLAAMELTPLKTEEAA